MVGAKAKGSSMGLHGNGDGFWGSWVLEAAGKASKAVRQAFEADGVGGLRGSWGGCSAEQRIKVARG